MNRPIYDPTTGHTMTPWRMAARGTCLMVVGAGAVLAELKDSARILERSEVKANGALIVRAVNSHDSLVNALEMALYTLARIAPPKPYDSTQGTRDVAEKALKLARGE